jgi:hypothetical protein
LVRQCGQPPRVLVVGAPVSSVVLLVDGFDEFVVVAVVVGVVDDDEVAEVVVVVVVVVAGPESGVSLSRTRP